jgi:serine/threonine protein kinase
VADVAGDVLGDRYRLVRALGSGAEGTVWLAHDEQRAIDVAVKILLRRLAASKETLRRFVSEAEVCRRMLSPHIVKVLERGVTSRRVPYTVYEHLDGEDLAVRLARTGPLPFADVGVIVLQTCRALARAHALGVLHRDVKPENLFVTTDQDGRLLVKMVDFGVAQVLGDVVTDRPLVGTLEYMAPEVLLAEGEPDVRSDLYSVGVVAYECVTGHVPFHADNVAQLVLALSSGERPSVCAARADAPPELGRWFDRALARDREQRFSDAKETAEALREALRSARARTTATIASKPERPRRRVTSIVLEGDRISAPYSIVRPAKK